MFRIFITVFTVLVSTVTFSQKQSKSSKVFFQKTDTFFKKYVSNGLVDYKSLSENPKSLNELIDLSNTIEVSNLEHKAFWINVYNLGVIQQIVNNYPIESPLNISGFFKSNKQLLGGKKLTLNTIENEILRKKYNDARLHFVLVCGALSCPPIINKAYLPKTLNEQLEIQTKLAVNNPEFIKVKENKVELSEIFSWYKQDFGNSTDNIIAFINKYRNHKIHNKQVGYYTYNWKLNTQQQNTSKQLSNVQTFTPSKLLAKGQFDIKFFNSLYTQTEITGENTIDFRRTPRINFFTSTTEFYIGVSKSARVNIGFIAQYKSNTENASATSVFQFKNDNVTARHGFTTFAPSIRIQPFKNIANFSFTSSVFFPIFKDKSNEVRNLLFLDKQSTFWETKFFYDYTFGGNKWQLFSEIDLGFDFGEKGGNEKFANNSLTIPTSLFLSYFPSEKSTVFINGQHREFVAIDNNGDFSQNSTSLGFGGKYQLTNQLNLEASVNKIVRGFNFQGLGQTFSIGLRYLSN